MTAGKGDLDRSLREHLAAPFPSSVSRGETYGAVCPVMIDADLVGWVERVAAGDRLPLEELARFARATGRLRASLPDFPGEGQRYYRRLLALAELALERSMSAR